MPAPNQLTRWVFVACHRVCAVLLKNINTQQSHEMKPTTMKNWHAQSIDDVLAALDASPAGLRQADALARLQRIGPNRLAEPPRRSALKRLLLQFHNILIYVLIASALITSIKPE